MQGGLWLSLWSSVIFQSCGGASAGRNTVARQLLDCQIVVA